jgi:hypothetical protein
MNNLFVRRRFYKELRRLAGEKAAEKETAKQ